MAMVLLLLAVVVVGRVEVDCGVNKVLQLSTFARGIFQCSSLYIFKLWQYRQVRVLCWQRLESVTDETSGFGALMSNLLTLLPVAGSVLPHCSLNSLTHSVSLHLLSHTPL